MKTVTAELEHLLSEKEFKAYHKTCSKDFDSDVRRFLNSTMDEVRTSVSSRLARAILEIIGISDFGVFRRAVLHRELTGSIAYAKQRDHSSHTLYNYLLGWYFFIHSKKIRAALLHEFKKRGVDSKSKGGEPHFRDYSAFFGNVWQYVSLLHDVGYMFEGGLPLLDFRNSNEQAEIGYGVAREYFNRQIWWEYDLNSISDRRKLLDALARKCEPPKFENAKSLAEIAEDLRSIGDLSELRGHVGRDMKQLNLPKKTYPQLGHLSEDAFELWEQQYRAFDNNAMAARIISLRKVFNGLIEDGLPKAEVRLLDHGVCSGLLQLSASTYYYRLYSAALNVRTKKNWAVNRFLSGRKWSPAFWWGGIVWATASAGVHNIQQLGSAANKMDKNWPGGLKLTDDPLAYLGILVDTVEEWDRYSVFKSLDQEPIQGTEVMLGVLSGKVKLEFLGSEKNRRTKKLIGDLDGSLLDWQSVLDVN
jgi:hypothetical protein